MFHEMKPFIRHSLGLLLIAACAAVWVLSTGMAQRELRTRTCQGKGKLQVTVTDSLERRFVARADVQEWLDKEYGAYAGLPLDSVDLTRIEKLICSHSAVRDCEAWITDDGVLHVELSQRQPVIRLEDGQNACYADETGYLFPLQSRGSVSVPVVSGKIPFPVQKGFKGYLEEPEKALWLDRVISLIGYMEGTVWEKDIRKINVRSDGELLLYPVEGKEEFLFGPPVRIPEKFKLLTAYYKSVAPSKDPGYYSKVDLRYRNQLVCKK